MNSPPLIQCIKMQKQYPMGQQTIYALHEIELIIRAGEYIAILGPSGSGKSTLMNLLGCLDTPTSGQYLLKGKDVTHLQRNELADIRNQQIGFIFQSFNLLAHITALDNVALPLVYRGISIRQRREAAQQLLTQVGLADRIQHLPNELSGGQRQRVAIARALVTNPDVILADEPTGNLDSQAGEEVISLFEKLSSQGKTIIVVTHDLNVAQRAKRIIRIKDGSIIEDIRTRVEV